MCAKFSGLILFSAMCVAASSPSLVLAVNYSEWLDPALLVSAIATDGSGALYILSNPVGASSTVMKLSADGKTIVWQNQLGFAASTMAVDPGGGVYVVPQRTQGNNAVSVAKLAASGTGLAWTMPAGFTALSEPVLTVDSQGRAYVAAQYITNNYITQTSDVVRVNAAGSGLDYTAQVMGVPSSIAVDQTGAAYVAGTETNAQGVNTGFLARLAPDGSAGFYSIFPFGQGQTVAVDASGNIVTLGNGLLQRVNSSGAVTLSTPVGSQGWFLALDAAGNAYVTGITNGLLAVKNSLAPCGLGPTPTQFVTVIAPDGSTLQTTYIPGADNSGGYPLIATGVATGPNSTVFLVARAGPSFAPTQPGPFPAGTSGSSFLTSLSPNATEQIYPLACMGSAAGLGVAAIASGELIALFGSGLGPQQGVQTHATLESPYPTQAAGVEVFFDGLAAPLLWVQDGQINAVAPWSLTPGANTQVCVTYNDSNTSCLSWPVVETAPAVFKVDGTYAAALNQDGTVNSANNPAPVGSIVTVFATGLGAITPPQTDGTLVGSPLPSNALPVSVAATYTIGIPFGMPVTVPFKVLYVGPAPDEVAGVSQINFQVQSFLSYGAIYLTVGTTTSQGFEVYIAGQ